MKRILVKLLAMSHALVFALAGCAQGSEGISDSETPAALTAGTEDTSLLDKSDVETEPTDTDDNKDDTKEEKAPWVFSVERGVSVRDVAIDIAGDGEAIEIIQISDIHYNAINDKDREENDPLVMGSYNDQTLWLKDGASNANVLKALKLAENADQIVLTGDLISYLSYGNLELLKENLWTPYGDRIMACVGNHDALRCWNAKTDESDTLEERIAILQEHWINDVYYSHKIIDERVMLIQMDNAMRSDYNKFFWDVQVELLRADIELAREKGYAVLLFYHIPLTTMNTKYFSTKPASQIGSGGNINFYTGGVGIAGGAGADKQIYDIITSSADVIKATFCGHHHGDYYTEIKATTPDGTETVIPQYVLTALPYQSGSITRITLK